MEVFRLFYNYNTVKNRESEKKQAYRVAKFYETLKLILRSVSTLELATFEKLRKIIYISEDDEEATMTRYFFSARITIEIINE